MADTNEKLRRDVATVNEYARENMIAMHVEDYVAMRQVCAALSDVLNAATPPADAALADALEAASNRCHGQDVAALRKAAAALRARQQAVAAFVPYTDAELREWFPVMCNHCGWRGLSRDCAGGGPIADTGDFNEITCPQCWADGDGKAVDPREVVVVDGRPQAVAEGFERVAWQRVSDDGKPLPIFVTLREHLSPVCKYRDVLAAGKSGFVVVPVEPTPEMVMAFMKEFYKKEKSFDTAACYRALLAASQSATGDAK